MKASEHLNLPPELIKFYEILKKIHENQGRCWFVPKQTSSKWEIRIFQETVVCLKEAKERGYIFDLKVTQGNENVDHMAIQAFVDGGLTLKGREIINFPNKLNSISENKLTALDMSTTTIHQNINAPVQGSVVAAKTIEHSFNSLNTSKADDDVKKLLVQLLTEVKALNDKIPPAQAQQFADIAEGTDTLISETSRESPRKKWYEASLDGIKDAAQTVGEIANPLLTVIEKLTPLLLG